MITPTKHTFDLEMIGRYQLLKKIGAGGFGVVYKGRDPYIGRDLAIKVSTLDAVGGDRSHLESFLRKLFIEAEAAGKLLHPNIVMVYDVGIQEPYYYLAMEYVEGKHLKQYCSREDILPVADAIDVMIKVCHGLDYAHQRGVIHRDIKSTNILLSTKGDVKIADFGLAYIVGVKESQLSFAGTPSYMSPEQLRREPPTAKSDLFSLGVVLYELLSGGERPFPGTELEEIRSLILEKPPRPLAMFHKGISPALVAAVERALAKDPADRYQDAMEFSRELERVMKAGEVSLTSEHAEKIRLLRSLVFFSDFTEDEMARLLQIGTWSTYQGGEIIVAQHDRESAFYVVTQGTAAAYKGSKKLGDIGRGQCFGEISFLLNAERSATVASVSDCQLLKLNPQKIEILPVETQVKLYRIFSRTLANRLLTADERSKSSS
ncbi:MAG: protein kinase [Deltaproteobacteria bacterium]|nr:protein kinase [Deltaproteobacteria bacterium]